MKSKKHIVFGSASVNKSYTLINQDKTFKNYIKFVKNYKCLSPEEQKQNIILYHQTGNQKYRDDVIYSNQLMIISLVKQSCNEQENIMDYIQSANIGLIHAFDKYDIGKGVSFYTYAVYWVRFYIESYRETIQGDTKFISKQSLIYIKKITEYVNDCFSTGKIPTYQDIMFEIKIHAKELNKMIDFILHHYNLYLYDNRHRIKEKEFITYMKHNISSIVSHVLVSDMEKTKDSIEYIENGFMKEHIINVLEKHKDNIPYCEDIINYLKGKDYCKYRLRTSIENIRKNKRLKEILKHELI